MISALRFFWTPTCFCRVVLVLIRTCNLIVFPCQEVRLSPVPMEVQNRKEMVAKLEFSRILPSFHQLSLYARVDYAF